MKNFPTKKNLNKSLKFTHQYLLQVTRSSEKQCYVQNIWKNVFDQVPISFLEEFLLNCLTFELELSLQMAQKKLLKKKVT